MVSISTEHDDYEYLIKPRQRYECGLFEQLFHFKCHCKDYDENKIIAVTNI